jgi:uncharacterized oxidoreductase
MNITSKIILVTGGGSGIGFETAKLLSQKGNEVIITGRNEDKLKKAAAQLDNVSFIACDINSKTDVNDLVERINKDYGKLDVLINNAGQAYVHKLDKSTDAYEKAADEIGAKRSSHCECDLDCCLCTGRKPANLCRK